MKRNWLTGFLHILLIVATGLFLVVSFFNKFLPFKYNIILVGIIVIIALIAFVVRNRLFKFFTILLVTTGIMLHMLPQHLITSTFPALESLGTEKVDYYLVGLKNSYITRNQDFSKAVYGLSSSESDNVNKIVSESLINKYSGTIHVNRYEDNETLINRLYDGNIDLAVISSKLYDSFTNEYSDFEERTTLLDSMTVSIPLIVNTVRVKNLDESFVVYLSGNDTFGELESESRSDVNILAIVNPNLGTIGLLSIPRDSYVELACVPGYPYDKLTHAGMYGLDCQIETIERMLGIEINYTVRLNFSGVHHILESLGNSLTIYNPYAFQGHTEEYYFEKGCLTLNKEQVLNYVRTRHELYNGDQGRQDHQKIVIKALMKKLTSANQILNIGNNINTIMSHVQTDIDSDFVQKLVKFQLDKWPNWEFITYYLETYGDTQTTYSMGDMPLSVQVLDEDKLQQLKTTITEFMGRKNKSEVPVVTVESNSQQTTTQNPSVSVESTAIIRTDEEVNVDQGIEYYAKFGEIVEPIQLELNGKTEEEACLLIH